MMKDKYSSLNGDPRTDRTIWNLARAIWNIMQVIHQIQALRYRPPAPEAVLSVVMI